jgi:hypothetical protein
MDNIPALDDAFDYRVEWFSSIAFRRAPNADFVEDYSGERFMLAYKPRSIRAIRDADAHGHGAKVAQGVTYTVFEFANLPFTSTTVVSYNHSPDEPDFWGAFR